MNYKAIIVAGGVGKRMQSIIPKQFLKIGDKPILTHTLKQFYNYNKHIEIILVLPEKEIMQWKKICQDYNFNIPHHIVPGGDTRFHSVKNGLKYIHEPCLVAVHDGVRPLVSTGTIDRTFQEAAQKGSAIPYQDIESSIRYTNGKNSKALNRKHYKIIQTPQVFNSEILQKAYQQSFEQAFTDDASVVENSGIQVNLVAGNPENIKITTEQDLQIAEVLLKYFRI